MTSGDAVVQQIAEEIGTLRQDPPAEYCAIAASYGFGGWEPGFKGELVAALGPRSTDAASWADAEYDAAYRYLFDLLPDCVGGCPCRPATNTAA